MAKNLASKLRTGAMVGLAALAVSAPMRAKADLTLSYNQAITEIDTNGDNVNDAYLSTLTVYNNTLDTSIPLVDKSYFKLNFDADLAGRGCTGLTNYWASENNTWHYETTGVDSSQFLLDKNGMAMEPGYDDKFYFTIPKNQVLGWENVNASMIANAGAVNFSFQAPKAVPEPTTMGALLTGAVALLAGRRIRDKYKY